MSDDKAPTARGAYAGEEIRELRLNLGLTQSEVSLAWGRPQPNLSEIELDKRRISPEAKKLLIATMRHLAKERAVAR